MAFNMHPASNQVRAPFNGILNVNEVFSTLHNAIIKEVVRYPELANNYNFINMFKEEGSKFGDTVTYTSMDVLRSREWEGDNEAMNLLALERPEDPNVQAITINKYRIVKTSTDSYLSARAWGTETAFSAFTGVIKSLVGKTKELYETTMLNCFLGCMEGDAEKSGDTVELAQIEADELTADAQRLKAQKIGETLANLFVDMKDYNRDYNSYGYMRAYNEDDIVVIWNSEWINTIQKNSLPTIFNAQGLIDKFKQHVLPAKYFGDVVDDISGHTGLTLESNGKIKIGSGYSGPQLVTMEEITVYDVDGKTILRHYFPGEKLSLNDEFVPGTAYIPNKKIICKVITKDSVKYMAGFTVSHEFQNPQALTTSNMLIWAYAEPTLMLDQPCFTLKADTNPSK